MFSPCSATLRYGSGRGWVCFCNMQRCSRGTKSERKRYILHSRGRMADGGVHATRTVLLEWKALQICVDVKPKLSYERGSTPRFAAMQILHQSS